MVKAFISYTRKVRDVTETLASDLTEMGHVPWFDQALSGGQEWWQHILELIRYCNAFIVDLDPDSLKYAAFKLESAYAHALGRTILPILVADCVSMNLLPPSVSRLQVIDYRDPDRKKTISLARTFTALPPARPLPDPLPAEPGAPVSSLSSLSAQVGPGGTCASSSPESHFRLYGMHSRRRS